jgi:hypothetical protein
MQRSAHLPVAAEERLVLAKAHVERRRFDGAVLLPDSHDVHSPCPVWCHGIDTVKEDSRPCSQALQRTVALKMRLNIVLIEGGLCI